MRMMTMRMTMGIKQQENEQEAQEGGGGGGGEAGRRSHCHCSQTTALERNAVYTLVVAIKSLSTLVPAYPKFPLGSLTALRSNSFGLYGRRQAWHQATLQGAFGQGSDVELGSNSFSVLSARRAVLFTFRNHYVTSATWMDESDPKLPHHITCTITGSVLFYIEYTYHVAAV